jgi:hypothetical protein
VGVRRGLLKDLANTPTQIACGWRMYEDIARLSGLAGSEIEIDLLSGDCTYDGLELLPPLTLANDVHQWMSERLSRDGVPQGMIQTATLGLTPRVDDRRRLTVDCSTRLATTHGLFESHDTAGWHPGDVQDIRDA